MTTITSLRIRRPDDLHVHLREGDALRSVLPHTARHFARALVMPNLRRPIVDDETLKWYREEILMLLPDGSPFDPLMTIKLTERTTAETVRHARKADAVAAKLYPEGVTTNSADGVSDVSRIGEAIAALEEHEMVLCLHAESPGVFCMDREEDFLSRHLMAIASRHPRLRIVVEHVSSAAAVKLVKEAPPTVAATITAHHLVITLDDVVGGMLSPHHFCKPIAKRPEDRLALVRAAMNSKKFFLGTDSAPHPRGSKECASGCAGCFTAPVALPILAQVFEQEKNLEALEEFTSVRGAAFYGLPPSSGEITLERKPWTVPAAYGEFVPFWAGKELAWSVREE